MSDETTAMIAATNGDGVTEPMLKIKRASVSVALTEAEREAVKWAADHLDNCGWSSATLRGLLKRLSEADHA